MKHARPRKHCPECGRSTAITVDARTGRDRLRSHVSTPGTPCPGSGKTARRGEPAHWDDGEVEGVGK